MPRMKTTRKYYFSVEGETEKWYLDWLQQTINSEPSATHKVSFDAKIEKNPLKRAKSITVLSKIEVTHLVDFESNSKVHTDQVITVLNLLQETSNIGKEIKYKLGYSNFTFELWIVLHKMDCNRSYTDRRQYLYPINDAYNERFVDLREYKKEANFRRILRKLSITDVKHAIERSKSIMQANRDNNLVLQQHKGYEYYSDNPSLSVWESIENILKDCKLI